MRRSRAEMEVRESHVTHVRTFSHRDDQYQIIQSSLQSTKLATRIFTTCNLIPVTPRPAPQDQSSNLNGPLGMNQV